MAIWRRVLKEDPVPWLLEGETPAVRHLALRHLLDQPADAPEVRRARAAAMRADPIASILAAQDAAGYWVKPGPGYAPKYRGAVAWLLNRQDPPGRWRNEAAGMGKMWGEIDPRARRANG
ncbi:MAG: hypothetical protein NVSMB65_15560 [Chloroflexota bacterium]